MKYKIFISDSIEVLYNETLLGEANTYKEACQLISKEISLANENPYWRICMNENGTFIDYGSWSHFAAIIPPVPDKVITGEVKEN